MTDELRIGDAERDEAMAALREHFAQGRLTREELDERLDLALSAKTAGELARVTADLPGEYGLRRLPGPGYGPGGQGNGPRGMTAWPGDGPRGTAAWPGDGPRGMPAWPGDGSRGGHGHRDPAGWRGFAWPDHDPRAWRAAMHAHRREMRRMRQARPWRRHRHGPPPFVPIVVVAVVAALVFGGFGILKVLLAIWVAALVIGFVRNAVIRSRL
ncbi:DUF1707 SHOCT-like domain-containing protein [Thermoactinospora rubra]|uniref:DUF1707 SHOCT-like domain-containing protein n=1 Tax=Thermoactinospora rubra TaxID=1088767 RepID=UPI000A1059D0|nr:DUF1707 domain-containing protein [Thermoactinospora rubra]